MTMLIFANSGRAKVARGMATCLFLFESRILEFGVPVFRRGGIPNDYVKFARAGFSKKWNS